MGSSIEALQFVPQFVPKIWGGRRLETVLKKNLPSGSIGESWEISGHRTHLTPVVAGQYTGQTIYDIAAQSGSEVYGRLATQCESDFPLLLKFIDASDVLSVQVHPDDTYSARHESSLGKSEAWIVVDCEPGSFLYRGFRDNATLKDFDALLAEGRLEEILRPVEVKPGDCIDLPATTVHAIGAGILLCEIQQSSDVTYRVYDWNRLGSDGKPRPLHVERARDVMDFDSSSSDKVESDKNLIDGGTHEILISSDKFVLERFHVESSIDIVRDDGLFHILCALDGKGEIVWDGGHVPLSKGGSILMPACLEEFSLSSSDGSLIATLISPFSHLRGE